MFVRHEVRRRYSQASRFIKSNEYSWSAFCTLCSQINLLLPREASGTTSTSCSVLRDSYFPLLLNQCNCLVKPECSVSKERHFYLPSDNFSQRCFFLFITDLSFQLFFRRQHHEFTMKSSTGNKVLLYFNHDLLRMQPPMFDV